MKIEDLPVIGRVAKTVNVLTVNFMLLGIVALVLGIVIPFYPQVLDIIVAAMLIVTALIFFNIAYRVHGYKKKYQDFFDKFDLS